MVNALVIALLLSIFSVEYLIQERELLHPYAVLIPEMLAAIAAVIVLTRMMAGVRPALDRRYVSFFVLLGIVLLAGFVLQGVPLGPVVAGVRAHLMFIPFFLLPAVHRFSSNELKIQLAVLLTALFAQAPLAFYQRFIEYASEMETGDVVRGTATTSSALSLLMMGGITLLVTLYLRRRIGLLVLLLGVGTLVVPTTLNETKATFVLMPMAFVIPALYMPRGSRVVRRFVPVAGVGVVAAIVFMGVYNYLSQYQPYGAEIGQFWTEGQFTEYLYAEAADREVDYIGRFDSIDIAWNRISQDPLTLLFGYGAGNVTLSFLDEFAGEYSSYYSRYGVGMTQVTTFLWEIGVAGLLAYLLFYYFLWRDARSLALGEGFNARLGQVWVTVIVIMALGLLYKSVFSMTEIGYLFWFYSGVMASRAVSQRRALPAAPPESAEAPEEPERAREPLAYGWYARERA